MPPSVFPPKNGIWISPKPAPISCSAFRSTSSPLTWALPKKPSAASGNRQCKAAAPLRFRLPNFLLTFINGLFYHTSSAGGAAFCQLCIVSSLLCKGSFQKINRYKNEKRSKLFYHRPARRHWRYHHLSHCA